MTAARPRRALIAAALAMLAVSLPQPSAASGTCSDPDDPAHATHGCKVQRLQQRSFVVVAVVDTGVNPYHVDFRVPGDDDLAGVHPSEFIDGFPSDVAVFDLELAAPSYAAAADADHFEWRALPHDTLVAFPGTKLIGGFSSSWDATWGGPVLDERSGHGTAVASVAAGAVHGIASDPDVLLVAVQGLHAEAVRWATDQPWIDIVTNSWGYAYNTPTTTSEHRTSRSFTDRGGLFVVAAGNGLGTAAIPCGTTPTFTSTMGGPPWQLTVGAVSPRNGQPHCWHSIPPDVSSFGSQWPAAAARSLDGEIAFSGTSNATPLVAGALAAVVLEARRTLGDTDTGPRDGALAIAADGVELPAAGPLADGRLTAAEAQELVLKTASVEPFEPSVVGEDPSTVPNTPAYFVHSGYGTVDAQTLTKALAVLQGDAALPDRSDVDAWMAVKDAATSFWTAVP